MILTLDTEATTYEKGSPFAQPNKLCCVGVFDGTSYTYLPIEHGALPYGEQLELLSKLLRKTRLLVGFNIKFDLNWIRRYLPDVVFPPVWDCQLAEFLLSHQLNPYPSLADTAFKYGLSAKLDLIKTEYWDRGLNTTEVPTDVLASYNEQDCRLTHQIYLRQKEELVGKQYTLFRLQCEDLLVLQDMEYNGLLYNCEESLKRSIELNDELQTELNNLNNMVPGAPFPNWNSPAQVSAFLYGGTIEFPCRVATTRTLKSGEVKHGTKWGTELVTFPRLVEPIDGSNNTQGYSTEAGILRSLKTNARTSKIISHLLRVSEIEKLRSTYYEGLPKLIHRMGWGRDVLHGQINQPVAITGRTSSSKPNLQNFDERIKELFYSRYAD